MRVLVVEDHKELAATIAVGLRREGMAVDIAFDGEDALAPRRRRQLRRRSCSTATCRSSTATTSAARSSRAGSRSRVLMLTAADTIERPCRRPRPRRRRLPRRSRSRSPSSSRASAPSRAATSPPCTPILVARRPPPRHRPARRDPRRPPARAQPEGARRARAAARGRRRAVSAEELLARAWDEYADPFSSVVKVTISRLRRKLGDPPLIETVPHAGYRIAGVTRRRARDSRRWPRVRLPRTDDPAAADARSTAALPLLRRRAARHHLRARPRTSTRGNFFISVRHGRRWSTSSVDGRRRSRSAPACESHTAGRHRRCR